MAIGAKELSLFIVGVACVNRGRIDGLRYVHGRGHEVEVILSLEPLPKNATDYAKHSLAMAMSRAKLRDISFQKLGRRFVPSVFNWSRCYAKSHELGLGGANVERVRKLFQVGMRCGGASPSDRLMRFAQPWQVEDQTYQLFGDEGRVIWAEA